LNICWVAGASAVANPLTAEVRVIWFMFPAALVLVGAMVVLLRMGYNLTRWNGAVLLALYAGYMALLLLGVGR
ncbi:MAG TPA: sodium:calcium antiporter, partial [Candidatus Hydrogenedentes bacterium]|nr:sodium:calcium antiporter [Candidatus Hydrogenedentota bacterium]